MRRQQLQCRSRSKFDAKSKLILRCVSPIIHDPKELHTLVLFSLRHLFGDLESHSYNMIVEFFDIYENKADADADLRYAIDLCKDNDVPLFAIRCCAESVSAIRASLTIVTPPPFLEDALYQFDVIHIYNL